MDSTSKPRPQTQISLDESLYSVYVYNYTVVFLAILVESTEKWQRV